MPLLLLPGFPELPVASWVPVSLFLAALIRSNSFSATEFSEFEPWYDLVTLTIWININIVINPILSLSLPPYLWQDPESNDLPSSVEKVSLLRLFLVVIGVIERRKLDGGGEGNGVLSGALLRPSLNHHHLQNIMHNSEFSGKVN